MKNQILMAHNFVAVPQPSNINLVSKEMLMTVLSNFMYYGYIPSMEVVEHLTKVSSIDLDIFWSQHKPVLEKITGENRKMDNFVVYKNFPEEVLSLSEAQYWFNQILMYWGVPNNELVEPALERAELTDKAQLKVLSLAKDNALELIKKELVSMCVSWSDDQKEYANFLYAEHFGALKEVDTLEFIDLEEFAFKENGIYIMANHFGRAILLMKDATDVLRLAARMSGASLNEKFKFKKFKRFERRILLSTLESTQNIEEDFARHPELWKKLLGALRPGDYKNMIKVSQAYNKLYLNKIKTFNAQLDSLISQTDEKALALVSMRPGEFYRRLHQLYNVFDMKAIVAFTKVVKSLSSLQLIKLEKYLKTVNTRKAFIYAPKGNWSRAQFVEKQKKPFSPEALNKLALSIAVELSARMEKHFPQGLALDEKMDNVKIQSNNQELAAYGRGTKFFIPENMTFIRSASFWQHATGGNNFFDNGWNFFDENWQTKGTVCWNHERMDNAAIFSGDPTNSKDLKGRACQMIDLYIDKLLALGVRYAVWNILSYSRIPFNQAGDVLATLQWGENAQTGKLYEPSRAQMVFPIKGDNLTKYIAYIDLVKREVVYIDANLPARVDSAHSNAHTLVEKMPAFVEYLEAQPSLYDLLKYAPVGKTAVVYSDKESAIEGLGYSFLKENVSSKIDTIDLNKILE